MILVVIGVTASGKTTVGKALAASLGWHFADGDEYHPARNIEKMRRGGGLADDDRWPWLDSLRGAIDAWTAEGRDTVLACSALKRAYRDHLRVSADVRFVYLRGSRELVEQRVDSRTGHFAGQEIVAGQFDALEEPGTDEPVITVDAASPVEDIVAEVQAALEA